MSHGHKLNHFDNVTLNKCVNKCDSDNDLRWTTLIQIRVPFKIFPTYDLIFVVFRQSQLELRQHIDSLSDDLKKASERQNAPIELDAYVKKLNNAKRRVMLVNNILQNAQVIMCSTF